jgi:hypothetical protein
MYMGLLLFKGRLTDGKGIQLLHFSKKRILLRCIIDIIITKQERP